MAGGIDGEIVGDVGPVLADNGDFVDGAGDSDLGERVRNLERALATVGRIGVVAADFAAQRTDQPGKRKRFLPRFGIGCRQLIDDCTGDDEPGDDE